MRMKIFRGIRLMDRLLEQIRLFLKGLIAGKDIGNICAILHKVE